jgi:hypothetical protein
MFSSEEWEENNVSLSCGLLVDGLANCFVFSEAFRNKPKALAILELAFQRRTSGPAPLFSQLVRESAHRFMRWIKDSSNWKKPELWIIASLHTRYYLKFLLEGGRLNVFDIVIDPATNRPDVNRNRLFQSPSALRNLLKDAFIGDEGISKVITLPKKEQKEVPDWVEKRKKPGKIAGMLEGSKFSGLNKMSLKPDHVFPWKGKVNTLRTRKGSPLIQLKSYVEPSGALRKAEFDKLKMFTHVQAEVQIVEKGSIFEDGQQKLYQVLSVSAWRLKSEQNVFSTHAVLFCQKMIAVEDKSLCVFEGLPCIYVRPIPDEYQLVEGPAVARVLVSLPCCNKNCNLEQGGSQILHQCPRNVFAVFRQKFYPEK